MISSMATADPVQVIDSTQMSVDTVSSASVQCGSEARTQSDMSASASSTQVSSDMSSDVRSENDADSLKGSWNDVFDPLNGLFVKDEDDDEDEDEEGVDGRRAMMDDEDDDSDTEWDYGVGMLDLPLNEDLDESVTSPAATQIVPLYPMGALEYTECAVCCDTVDLYLRACCEGPVCDPCMVTYITMQVEDARVVKMACPCGDPCTSYVPRDEIIVRLEGPTKDKFFRFLVDANKEKHIKTCPRCSTVTTVEPNLVHRPDKMGVDVVCTDCELLWCFVCQAPVHPGMTCKAFRRGDKLLSKWAKENHFGQANAQKCPKCKAFISRTSGCDHMTCSQCHTEFCYRCGGRFMSFRFLGDHYNRLSIFGCKYRLWPENPSRRKFVRGSIFAGKLAVVPVAAGLAAGACAVVAAAGIFILPVVGGIRIHKWRKRKRAQKAAAQARKEWRERLQEIRNTGDPYIERYNLMRLNPSTLTRLNRLQSSESLPDVLMRRERSSLYEVMDAAREGEEEVRPSKQAAGKKIIKEGSVSEGGMRDEEEDGRTRTEEEELVLAELCAMMDKEVTTSNKLEDDEDEIFFTYTNYNQAQNTHGKVCNKTDGQKDISKGEESKEVQSPAVLKDLCKEELAREKHHSEGEETSDMVESETAEKCSKVDEELGLEKNNVVPEKNVQISLESYVNEEKNLKETFTDVDERNIEVMVADGDSNEESDQVCDTEMCTDSCVEDCKENVLEIAKEVCKEGEKENNKDSVKEIGKDNAKENGKDNAKENGKDNLREIGKESVKEIVKEGADIGGKEEQLVQKSLYKKSGKPRNGKDDAEEGRKMRAIVCQYSCLGGRSAEEEEEEEVYDGEEMGGGGLAGQGGMKKNNNNKGKLMIRSASYDVAIREGENMSVSVKQMVKRYSQSSS